MCIRDRFLIVDKIHFPMYRLDNSFVKIVLHLAIYNKKLKGLFFNVTQCSLYMRWSRFMLLPLTTVANNLELKMKTCEEKIQSIEVRLSQNCQYFIGCTLAHLISPVISMCSWIVWSQFNVPLLLIECHWYSHVDCLVSVQRATTIN